MEIEGIAIAPIIVAIIALAKHYNFPKEHAPLLNAVLSLVGYGVFISVQNGWADATVVVYVLNAVIIFVAGAGLYDLAQKRIPLNL